ncbi:exosortase C-terminal domain/associated protein EpsI [Bryobacter aggregatus]|uniref:exosortase C-terminal domain/associated protein EpsI n=1 Tax=Bryobacter aggregatus TaxID=360054 RepID=UPI0004E14D18|nr:exosortase C-terminal domain/associated protein EpsI [Bryobacter aggregatus]
MPEHKRNQFLSSTVLILTAFLAAQTGLYFLLTKAEKVAAARPLSQFPDQLGSWTKTQEGVVDEATQAILKADDTLTRYYGSSQAGVGANLFIAAFRSQRTGAVPHSPKNCLPGSGWTWTVNDRIPLTLPGRSQPIEVNRYIVQRGESKSLVLYWYQSRDRAVASEYMAKLYTMLDAIRDNRTDTALVRVVVPLNGNDGDEKALAAAEDFVRSFYTPLLKYLPA